jgi:ribokinase
LRILNFGSLNVDHVYTVKRFVAPGETLDADSYSVFAGGKGFNQSIALARAGARVAHAGCVGEDGRWLRDELSGEGVDVEHLREVEAPTGHAVIQVDPAGENCILIHGGANQGLTTDHIDAALASVSGDAAVLLQNETSQLPEIIDRSATRGLHVILNPSPLNDAIGHAPLERVDTFVLNRVEGERLSGEPSADGILAVLRERHPQAAIVLTLGEGGVRYADASGEQSGETERVRAVDTTAAGDTFTGYFVAARARGEPVSEALRIACRAAALCVQRPGAAASIPTRDEL